jgi:hypothetical protein
VEIAFSIDDVGERFEYQRHPAKWTEVNEHVTKFNELKKTHKNIKTQVCCTINMQNIYNLEMVARWIDTQDFDYIFYNYLHEAKEWNVQYLPQKYKDKIQLKLISSNVNGQQGKEINKALAFMMDKNLGNKEMDERRKAKIIASDKFRDQNFESIHTEYEGLL